MQLVSRPTLPSTTKINWQNNKSTMFSNNSNQRQKFYYNHSSQYQQQQSDSSSQNSKNMNSTIMIHPRIQHTLEVRSIWCASLSSICNISITSLDKSKRNQSDSTNYHPIWPFITILLFDWLITSMNDFCHSIWNRLRLLPSIDVCHIQYAIRVLPQDKVSRNPIDLGVF